VSDDLPIKYGNDYRQSNDAELAAGWFGSSETEQVAGSNQPTATDQGGEIRDRATAGSGGSDYARSWQPIDLASVLDGVWEPPEPTVGRRTDGVGLFYPGRSHTIVSETEGGKTWLALCGSQDELRAGNHVLYVDFEDSEGSIVGRLLAFGLLREIIAKQFHYVRPTEPLGTGINLDDLRRIMTEHRPTLVVLDGITEAMTLHGLNPLDNADAARFGRILPRRITQTGAAVASLDHVVKDRDGRGRYALGAVHKLNGLDGAAYMLENRKPFGIGLTGRSTIKLAKDRPGQLRKHAVSSAGGMFWFGDLVIESHGEEFVEATIEPPADDGDDFRPTVLMRRIASVLDEHGPLSGKKIEALVTGKAVTVRRALTLLQVDGYVTDTTPHELLKHYPPEGESR
jgi:hypothetical protein